jgi:hypothetical protein
MPQFELESPITYYGSYTDNIVTGSILPNGLRGFAGSVVSGSLQFKAAKTVFDYIRDYLRQGSGTFFRNLKIYSKEIIYDSIVPNIWEIYRINGGQYVFSDNDAVLSPEVRAKPIIKFVFGNYSSFVTGSDNKQVSDNKWLASFPFANEYRNVPRLIKDIIPMNTSSYVEQATTPALLYAPISANFVSQSFDYHVNFTVLNNATGLNKPNVIYNYTGTVDDTDSFVATAVSGSIGIGFRDLNKLLFGSKPNLLQPPSLETVRTVSYLYFIRGWKYGLYSGMQSKTSIVYRRGHYGQFRDMLEQRLYTKNYIEETGTVENVINISFLSGSSAAITASNPTLNTSGSGIFDSAYQRTLPWFD